MLVDHEAGKVIEVLLSRATEDLQQGDETMNSYAPGEGSMHRISVERFDVPGANLLRCRLGGTWTDLVIKITADKNG